jgi:branched-chain amino acid transport system permease protein
VSYTALTPRAGTPVSGRRSRRSASQWRRSPYLRTDYRGELALFPYSGPRLAGIGVLALVLLGFPLVADSYWLGVANFAAIAAIGALGLQIVTGMAGQLSLGHAAFLAVGGFFAAGLYLHLGLPFWAAVPAAVLAGATLGAVAGLPALRIRGFYLGITTLAVQYVVVAAGLRYQGYLQTSLGTSGSLTVPAPDLWLFSLTEVWQWYLFLLVVLTAVALGVTNLRRSSLGRSFLAVRQRELAAEALGVDVARVKIMAFALSGALGGLAGALSTYYYRNVSIEDFDLLLSVSYLAMVIIGGLGSVQGAIYGAVFVTATPFLVGKAVEVLGLTAVLGTRLRAIELGVFALTMMAFLLFEPQGLAGVWQRVKAYFARWPFKYTDMTTSAKR